MTISYYLLGTILSLILVTVLVLWLPDDVMDLTYWDILKALATVLLVLIIDFTLFKLSLDKRYVK